MIYSLASLLYFNMIVFSRFFQQNSVVYKKLCTMS